MIVTNLLERYSTAMCYFKSFPLTFIISILSMSINCHDLSCAHIDWFLSLFYPNDSISVICQHSPYLNVCFNEWQGQEHVNTGILCLLHVTNPNNTKFVVTYFSPISDPRPRIQSIDLFQLFWLILCDPGPQTLLMWPW